MWGSRPHTITPEDGVPTFSAPAGLSDLKALAFCKGETKEVPENRIENGGYD
jgi:hypothetical protein